jgi:hypothetical protein
MSKVQKKQPVKTDQNSTNDVVSMQLDSPLRICDKTGATVNILDVLRFKSAKSMSIDDVLAAKRFFNLALTSGAVQNQNAFLFDLFESIAPILDVEIASDHKVSGFLEVLFSDLIEFSSIVAPKILTGFLTDSNFKKAEELVKNFRPIAAVIRNIKSNPDDFIGFGHEVLKDCIGVDLKTIDSSVFLAACYKLVEVCHVKKTRSAFPSAS